MGNKASKQQKQIARQAKVNLKAVIWIIQELKRKSGGDKYLSEEHIHYASPEFRQIVKHAIDINQDGKLAVEEYASFLVLLCSHNTECWLQELFRVFDSDNNGSISLDEVKTIFAAADAMIERDYDEQRAKEFFEKVDSNSDGDISLQEFLHHARDDSAIMKVLQEIRDLILEQINGRPDSQTS